MASHPYSSYPYDPGQSGQSGQDPRQHSHNQHPPQHRQSSHAHHQHLQQALHHSHSAPGQRHADGHHPSPHHPLPSPSLSDPNVSPQLVTIHQFQPDGHYPSSFTTTTTYYHDPASSDQGYLHPTTPHVNVYPPPLPPVHEVPEQEPRHRPPLQLDIPPSASFPAPGSGGTHTPPVYMGHQQPQNLSTSTSPYMTTPVCSVHPSSVGNDSYFPPYSSPPIPAHSTFQNLSPQWSSTIPPDPRIHEGTNGSTAKTGRGRGGSHGAKTSRQQFTACGACRHRRVKCDLKDRQEEAERLGFDDDGRGPGPHRNSGSGSSRRQRVSCTNCRERGTNCVDEYAPLKAAKQLRRGKRISEIEMLYGRSVASAAVSNLDETASDKSDKSSSSSTKAATTKEPVPELTKEFFDSPFFRRFQIQRPIIDPVEFVGRYLSTNPPTAAAMGREGAILCQVLYAWAVSYGVDENGELDVAEGGDAPDGPVDPLRPGPGEMKREADRQRRRAKMVNALEVALKGIDDCGIMRKPSWDGVRALLLILPLTEGVSTSVERLAMYEAAISQVYTLCSHIGVGYDGRPSAFSAANGGTDQVGLHDLQLVRIRIYWYAFVHEGITAGLKGGRLHLDDEDMETMQEVVEDRALVLNNSLLRATAKFATAPINLALACRLINKALIGPAARRRKHVDPEAVKRAWEALESCWEEFESVKNMSPQHGYATGDEVMRFAEGWRIFLFEAQVVIEKSLQERLDRLKTDTGSSAFIVDPQTDSTAEAVNIKHLLDIARGKCETKARQVIDIVRMFAGTRFFEWDASLVRDGTFYAAMLLVKNGGSDEDITLCIRALNELRWVHAKAWERTEQLRQEWAKQRQAVWDATMDHKPELYASLDGYVESKNSSLSNSGTSAHSSDLGVQFPHTQTPGTYHHSNVPLPHTSESHDPFEHTLDGQGGPTTHSGGALGLVPPPLPGYTATTIPAEDWYAIYHPPNPVVPPRLPSSIMSSNRHASGTSGWTSHSHSTSTSQHHQHHQHHQQQGHQSHHAPPHSHTTATAMPVDGVASGLGVGAIGATTVPVGHAAGSGQYKAWQ